jgi:hypothetical protein
VKARLVAAFCAVFWGYLFFGIIDLAVVLDRTPGFYDSYLLETGWGLLFTVLVAAPMAVLSVRPTLVMPVTQVAVVAVCVAVPAVVAPYARLLFPAAGLLLSAAVVSVLAGPRRWEIRPRSRDEGAGLTPHWPLLALAVLTLPLGAFTAGELVMSFRDQRQPIDQTWGIDHWPMQAALALAIPAVAGMAALRLPGWRLSAATAAVSAGWWGLTSISYPEHAGSLGARGGWSAVAWGAVVGVLVVAASRPRPPSPQ